MATLFDTRTTPTRRITHKLTKPRRPTHEGKDDGALPSERRDRRGSVCHANLADVVEHVVLLALMGQHAVAYVDTPSPT